MNKTTNTLIRLIIQCLFFKYYNYISFKLHIRNTKECV